MKKAPPIEMNETSSNRSLTAKFGDSQPINECTTISNNYQAAHAFLVAIPTMSRKELTTAISTLEPDNMAPGAQRIVFTAIRASQRLFPARRNPVEALTVIQSHLTHSGNNSLPGVADLIVQMATAPRTGIPASELAFTVRMETAARTMNELVYRRMVGDLDSSEVAA